MPPASSPRHIEARAARCRFAKPKFICEGMCCTTKSACQEVRKSELGCRDTAVLCESLTYERGPPAILNGNAVPGRPWTTVYSPPFDEFEVEHVLIPEKARFEGIQTYLPENLVSWQPRLAPSHGVYAMQSA